MKKYIFIIITSLLFSSKAFCQNLVEGAKNSIYQINSFVDGSDGFAFGRLNLVEGDLSGSLGYNNYVRRPDSYAFGRPKYNVGDFAFGGVVFSVDASGDHGLVCAIEDQSSDVPWSDATYLFETLAKGESIYAGKSNTSIIIAVNAARHDVNNPSATEHAALLSAKYQGGGYNDWYLPSKVELNFMYVRRDIINATALANGGSSFTDSYYWSSTEVDLASAWNKNFEFGSDHESGKENLECSVN